MEINYTGTALLYRPGAIVGGSILHECGPKRAIGYYLEPVIALAPFSKTPFMLTLKGVTNDASELTVDTLRTAVLPQLSRFGIEDGIELKINKRGAWPKGGGEVFFTCPVVRAIKPCQFTDEGRIKRIRGIAYATRVNPQTANRMVESARSLLNHFIPDVYIYSDVYRGAESGNSPGFGLSLVAETTTGALFSSDAVAKGGETPEDIGLMSAKLLYHEISLGGCVDTVNQWIILLLMCLGPEDVSKIRLGKLSPMTIQFLRDLRSVFGTTFKIKTDSKNKSVVMTCLGIGYVNVNKKAT